MDRYQKVEKPRSGEPINENEIRITSQGLVRNYLTYATTLLQERRGKEIVIKAMGQAISKTVTIVEILKRRLPQLHQDTSIGSVSIVDVWEPIEEGLLPVETSRQVSMISITLSLNELNKNSPGYQAPHHAEQSRPKVNYQQQKSQQQPRQARPIYVVGSEGDLYSYGRGRGQGRGQGRGRGWSRGGYDNYEGTYQRNYQGGYPRNYQGGYQGNYQSGYQGSYQDNGGYSNWSRGGGRASRGTGYSYRGTGYGRGGRGRSRGGGRGYGRSFGRMDGYLRGGYNQE